VTVRERERLVARIRQIRRVSVEADEPARPSTSGPGQDDLCTLEARITNLEQLVRGLEDSVQRESRRLSKRIGVLEAQIQTAGLGRALSDDARERGE
jgi:hypothetical protein